MLTVISDIVYIPLVQNQSIEHAVLAYNQSLTAVCDTSEVTREMII